MFALSAIEQAIKDAVLALKRPYIADVATYGGEFDVSDDEFSQVIKRFPAVWVTFAGTDNIEPHGNQFKVNLQYTVLVGARSTRTEETARMGVMVDGRMVSVGTYQLAKDVLKAVLGKTFGLKVSKFKPTKITTVFNTKLNADAISVLAIGFSTFILVNEDEFDCALDDAEYIEKINVNYALNTLSLTPDMKTQVSASDVLKVVP